MVKSRSLNNFFRLFLGISLLGFGAVAFYLGAYYDRTHKIDEKPKPVLLPNLPPELPTELDTQRTNNFAAFQRYWQNTYASIVGKSKKDYVGKEDVQRYVEVNIAAQRTQIISDFLKMDLNGNGLIDPSEIEFFKVYRPSSLSIFFDRNEVEATDLNHDGYITFREMLSRARKQVSQENQQPFNDIAYLMIFDQNHDNILIKEELDQALDTMKPKTAVKRTEKKKSKQSLKLNKSTSQKKSKPISHVTPAGQILKISNSCSFPKLKTSDMFIVAGASQGDLHSNVAIGHMKGRTSIARIHIEKGHKKLYLVVTSDTPVIWYIDGYTNRVRKMVVQAGKGQQKADAVIGLPKKRLTFLPNSCFPHISHQNGKEWILSPGRLNQLTGRKPDLLTAKNTFTRLVIPSNNYDRNIHIETNSLRCANGECVYPPSSLGPYPLEGRVVMLNPNDIIASDNILKYDILPGLDGLQQLVEKGILKDLHQNTYQIIKPLSSFPPGLTGRNAVAFILSEGLTYPKGDIGDSIVYSEKTGQILAPPQNNDKN